MKRLGISIYPEKASFEETCMYMERAARSGCSRIFSCLLSIQSSREEIVRHFTAVNKHAHELGFEVVLDCNPRVMKDLGTSYKDLSFFKAVGADGIRLDMGFSGLEESLMTFSPEGLFIEINMSNNVNYLDTIMDYMPDKTRLVGSHNFYPHAYTGLTVEHFQACNQRFNRYGLNTACFITSQAPHSFANWPVVQGLPTLEAHRYLPLHLQIEHIIALGGIDDIMISNCYPSDKEWANIENLPRNMVCFTAQLIPDLPPLERSIVLDELHFNRGDVSANLIRSTQSRVKYKDHEFKLIHPVDIHAGDIVLESSLYGHYAGELQIAKTAMKNSGKSSVIGHIAEDELFLLDLIKPWQKFKFRCA